MSADFWAGYVSGAIGILVGNPLDLIKVRQQASGRAATNPHLRNLVGLATGTAAPVLGYGALNAILFVFYNRTEAALNKALGSENNLWVTWLAGAVGGLATWVVSTPTELIKCRAQISSTPSSSWDITKRVWQTEGLRGLYFGGVVTALRDSIGYGFYFWTYEGLGRSWPSDDGQRGLNSSSFHEAPKILVCGGLAGIVTWASVFPLDVVKTRVQTQLYDSSMEHRQLLEGQSSNLPVRKMGAMEVARATYRQGGVRVFFAGLAVCSIRAFIVNAVQWGVYEWMMHSFRERRPRTLLSSSDSTIS